MPGVGFNQPISKAAPAEKADKRRNGKNGEIGLGSDVDSRVDVEIDNGEEGGADDAVDGLAQEIARRGHLAQAVEIINIEN